MQINAFEVTGSFAQIYNNIVTPCFDSLHKGYLIPTLVSTGIQGLAFMEREQNETEILKRLKASLVLSSIVE